MRSGEPPAWVERSSVLTEDSESIDVWRVAAVHQQRGVALLFRGNGEVLHGIARFQKFLAENDITTYSFDYRGSGESSGWPSEEGLYRDSRAVAKFILEKEKISAPELSLVGISIGTGPASYLAHEIGAGKLLLVSPYHDLRMLVREMPFFGLLSTFLRYDLPTVKYLSQLSKTKVTIYHGTQDTTIPFHHSQRIMAEVPADRAPALVRIEGGGHNDMLGHVADQLVEKLREAAHLPLPEVSPVLPSVN